MFKVFFVAFALLNSLFARNRGGDFPYTSYECEDGTLGGGATIIEAINRDPGEPGGEASGRKTVKLGGTGAYVDVKSTVAFNSIVLRASIPNSKTNVTLTVQVDGADAGVLILNSLYTHLCGSLDGPNQCGVGTEGFHMYDDFRLLLKGSYAAGAVVRLIKSASDSAGWYYVDRFDLEDVKPPVTDSTGYANILDYGAREGENSSPAIAAAIDDALAKKLKGIFIPAGNWPMDNINGVTDTGKVQLPSSVNAHPTKFEIAGAGMWHTRLYAVNPGNDDWGRNWGFDCQGQTVYYHDFMMEGQNRVRTEGGKPLVNGYGADTVIENLWIEHSTIGFWVGGAFNDFPANTTQRQKQSNGLIIKDSRCRNTGADGINLCAGTQNATVTNVNCRNNGDDALAIWSENDGWVKSGDMSEGGNQLNLIEYCTGELPWRANGIGMYGGRDNAIDNVIIADVLTYHGIMIDSGTFPSVAAAGTLNVTNTSFIRTSGVFWGQTWSAIGVYKNPGQAILFDTIEVLDTWYGVWRFEVNGEGVFQNVVVDKYLQYQKESPGNWGVGFIFKTGDGNYTFINITQSGFGHGPCESFWGNPGKPSVTLGEGCNFDANGPFGSSSANCSDIVGYRAPLQPVTPIETVVFRQKGAFRDMLAAVAVETEKKESDGEKTARQ